MNTSQVGLQGNSRSNPEALRRQAKNLLRVNQLDERWEVCSRHEEPMNGGPVTKIVDRCRHTVTPVRARCRASPSYKARSCVLSRGAPVAPCAPPIIPWVSRSTCRRCARSTSASVWPLAGLRSSRDAAATRPGCIGSLSICDSLALTGRLRQAPATVAKSAPTACSQGRNADRTLPGIMGG
jgi:hypothetical protein